MILFINEINNTTEYGIHSKVKFYYFLISQNQFDIIVEFESN